MTKKIILQITFLSVVFWYPFDCFAEISISASDSLTQTGFFQLKWQSDQQADFVLQQDTTLEFKTPKVLYNGPDTARAISGLLNGNYYYRVRIASNDWSGPVKVVVEHYKLSTALLFLGMGALVFLSTAILIINGYIKTKKHQTDTDG